jgi:hypothetical protein
MFKYLNFIFVLAVWIASQKVAVAQTTYPVQVSTYMVPPYSLYLSDYYSGTRDKLVVQLVNRDMQNPTINVLLRMTITAGGVKLTTNPNSVTQPIAVDTGVPLRLTQDELAPYFQPANLVSQGFLAEGKLPEGVVEFCFQAIEAHTGRVVSLPSCTRAWVTSQKPPLLSLPLNNENILFREPLNLMFQWTPRHQGLTYVEYEFILKELWDNGMTPQAAFAYSPEIVRETVHSTSYIYGAMQPPLLPGKRYAWAVRAVARDGVDVTNVFQNDGLSEIRWFTLQDNCAPPTVVTATAERRAINLEWKSVPENIGFTVSYRPMPKDGSSSNDDWKELESQESHVIVNGLKNGTTYQYRVGNYCMAGQPVYSPLFTITLPSTDSARLAQCGIMPAINLTNKEPIKELKTAEVFKANDYPITITKISGAGGTYTGEGWTIIPFLEDAKIAVKFTSITINTDKQMIDGYVETKYDKNEGQIANLDKLTEGGFDVGTVKTGITKVDYKFDFAIPGVDAFSLNDEGQLVIKDVDGTPHTVDTSDKTGQGNEGSKVQVFPMTVQDKNGNVYQVEKVVEKDASGNEHEVAKATYIGKASDPLTADNFDATQLDGDKAIVKFSKGEGYYAFDEWLDYYDKVALIKPKYEDPLYNGYHVPWKLLVEGKTDVVKANIEVKDKTIDPKKVIFKTPKGTEFKADYNEANKEYTIQLVAGPVNDVQEIYALHPKSDGKYYNLGKLSLATYAAQTYDVVLVPVAVPVGSGNETGYVDADAIKQTLNDTCGQVGVTWNVTRDDPFEYSGEYHLMANSTGLATYNEAMRALNNAYKEGRPKVYNANVNVLFFLLNSGSSDHSRDFNGFMPRGAQFGYIFTSEMATANIPATVAHELGHGRWKLFHTFDEHYGGFDEAKNTDNLMAYANGQHIAKWQWDVMNDPAWIVNIFEGDDKGAYYSKTEMIEFLKTVKANNKKYANTNDPQTGAYLTKQVVTKDDIQDQKIIDFMSSVSLYQPRWPEKINDPQIGPFVSMLQRADKNDEWKKLIDASADPVPYDRNPIMLAKKMEIETDTKEKFTLSMNGYSLGDKSITLYAYQTQIDDGVKLTFFNALKATSGVPNAADEKNKVNILKAFDITVHSKNLDEFKKYIELRGSIDIVEEDSKNEDVIIEVNRKRSNKYITVSELTILGTNLKGGVLELGIGTDEESKSNCSDYKASCFECKRIPNGEYPFKVSDETLPQGQHKYKTLQLLNTTVNGSKRDGILIHMGDDISWTQGCLLAMYDNEIEEIIQDDANIDSRFMGYVDKIDEKNASRAFIFSIIEFIEQKEQALGKSLNKKVIIKSDPNEQTLNVSMTYFDQLQKANRNYFEKNLYNKAAEQFNLFARDFQGKAIQDLIGTKLTEYTSTLIGSLTKKTYSESDTKALYESKWKELMDKNSSFTFSLMQDQLSKKVEDFRSVLKTAITTLITDGEVLNALFQSSSNTLLRRNVFNSFRVIDGSTSKIGPFVTSNYLPGDYDKILSDTKSKMISAELANLVKNLKD